jgi:hypothetical protein
MGINDHIISIGDADHPCDNEDCPLCTRQINSTAVDICSLVLTDIETRRAVGMERYGVPLTPHNGKDALMEAYEEALDLIIYLRQYIHEQRGI